MGDLILLTTNYVDPIPAAVAQPKPTPQEPVDNGSQSDSKRRFGWLFFGLESFVHEIAAKLTEESGQPVTAAQVATDLSAIKQAWSTRKPVELPNEARTRELQWLQRLEDATMVEWHAASRKAAAVSLGSLRQSSRSASGNSALLKVLLEIQDRRMRLLGLDTAPSPAAIAPPDKSGAPKPLVEEEMRAIILRHMIRSIEEEPEVAKAAEETLQAIKDRAAADRVSLAHIFGNSSPGPLQKPGNEEAQNVL